MISRRSRRHGFSLIELMVAMVAGLIVSSAALAFLMSSFRSNGEYVLSTRLTQELRSSLDLVSHELRRAGYNEDALELVATGKKSPFSRMKFDILAAAGPPASYQCIIYSYDRSGGTPGALDVAAGEVRGLRRAVVGGVGVIEYAISSGAAAPTCGDGTATADYTSFPPKPKAMWYALSDPSLLNITAFTLTDRGDTLAAGLGVREIGVQISGQLTGSAEFTRTVSSTIRTRADCFIENTFATDCAASY